METGRNAEPFCADMMGRTVYTAVSSYHYISVTFNFRRPMFLIFRSDFSFYTCHRSYSPISSHKPDTDLLLNIMKSRLTEYDYIIFFGTS
jgi:hypothetical protein